VIRFHYDLSPHYRWIGIDLNTTGHAVVAAEILSGKVLKLGKKIQYTSTSSVKNCAKLYRENKLWKLKRMKTREKKEFRAALHKIARQIVNFADAACAGIKFEKLFSFKYLNYFQAEDSYEFSFENGSFVTLLHLVEKRALNRGIPVLYVNPANTSKRCSRCGGYGKRVRKRFECPQCGLVIHADVNAAFNIAATSCVSEKAELYRMRTSRRQMRKLARMAGALPENGIHDIPDPSCHREILSRWEDTPVISAPALTDSLA
jgi:putative transposase